MPKRLDEILIVLSVIAILAGLALDLHDRSLYGFPILLGGGAVMAGAVLWRSRVMPPAPTIGFLVGAAVPLAVGVSGIAYSVAYHNAHPDAYVCGTSGCLTFALIFILGPACGVFGAAVVVISSSLWRFFRHAASSTSPDP